MTSITYSIAPSDMAFHALTTSLYKDRLRAPVREILSNAIDIQRRTGNTTPIEIKLPTVLDAQFRIRDFGTGLSKSDMLRLYSTLFSSDKHLARANEVGGFGVGAKSPFAYTDAFTVESFHKGTHTIYSAFMDGNRAPQLVELFNTPTTEPDGLAVSYPIAKSDEAALRGVVVQEVAICGHPVECIGVSEPIVPLETNSNFEKVANVWVGSDRSLISRRNDRETSAYARMGNVIYPIRTSDSYPKDLRAAMQLVSHIVDRHDREWSSYDDEENDNKKKNVAWDTAIFELSIGSVRPAMSREELVANDPLTIQGLREAYGTAIQGFYRRALLLGTRAERAQLMEAHLRCFTDASAPTTELERALNSEYKTLLGVIEAEHEQDKVWSETSRFVHPGMMRGRGFFEHSHHSFLDMTHHAERTAHMLQEGFPRVEEFFEYRGYTADPWSDKKSALMLVPFDNKTSSWVRDFLNCQEDAPPVAFRAPPKHRRSHPKKPLNAWTSVIDKTLSNSYTEALVDTLASAEDMAHLHQRGRGFHLPMLMFATSEQHEAELMARADKMGRRIAVLNLHTRQASMREPGMENLADIENSTNPANPAAPSKVKIDAWYWDEAAQTMQETQLDALPPYWFAGNHDPHAQRVVTAWQQFAGAPSEGVFYLVQSHHPEVVAFGDAISPAWRDFANSMTKAEHAPKTRLEWLLASSPLPMDHPLCNEKATQYVQCQNLFQRLSQTWDARQDYRSHNYPRGLKLAPLNVYAPANIAGLDKTLFEKEVFKTYPLLSQLSDRVFTEMAYKQRGRGPDEHTDYEQAVAQYIALVDAMHPQTPTVLKTHEVEPDKNQLPPSSAELGL